MKGPSSTWLLARLAVIATLCAGPIAALPNPIDFSQAGVLISDLLGRDSCAGGTVCGWNNQLCCSAGSVCYTNAADQAECSAAATTAAQASGGYWTYWTSTYTMTNYETYTSVFSSYYGSATATATAACNHALNEQQCGLICCASNQYCFNSALPSCAPLGNGGSSGYYSTFTTPTATAFTTAKTATTSPGLPLIGTSSGETTVTQTASPTTTVPYITPVATGANITVTGQSSSSSSGLSGGAIAGIVIGSIAGVLLLALICFYCCVAGLIDTILACFGLGRRRDRRTVEVEEYERHSSRHDGGAAAGGAAGGRKWWGVVGPRRPQQQQVQRRRKEGVSGSTVLIGAGALAALWAFLGMKRKRDQRREEEKYSEYTYDDTDYMYTSESSRSTDVRDVRDSRRSISRR